MNPQKIVELATLLRNNGDKILNSEFSLTLTGSLLCGLNDSFTLIIDTVDNNGDYGSKNFQVLKPINAKSTVFRDLQLIYDFIQKTPLLCLVHYPTEEYYDGVTDIKKFRALKRLEVHKVSIHQVIGIQPLRGQLQQLVCIKSLQNVDDIITKCGGDNSNGFVWNELIVADFSYNNLKQVDTSLEFAQYLQHLNLRHNQLHSVTAIKWLPHLKTLDLSFNRLMAVPQFHMDTCKRLQTLNMSNNLLEDLMGVIKLEALRNLDVSDNCLLDHTYLLPLTMLTSLENLNVYGNPLHCHPKHRLATVQYLNPKCANDTGNKFILDFEPLAKKEKQLVGTQKLKQIGALNRYTTTRSVTSSSALSTPGRLTPSSNQTPSSSLGSIKSFFYLNTSDNSEINAYSKTVRKLPKKRSQKIRTVEIHDNVDSIAATSTIATTTLATSTNKIDSQYEKHLSTMANKDMNKSSLIIQAQSTQDHLETKRHVETLRKKYGNEWLQEDKVETLNQVLGLPNNSGSRENGELNKSRQLFEEYLQFVPPNDKNTAKSLKEDEGNCQEELANSENMSIAIKSNNVLSANDNAEQNQRNTTESSVYESLENIQNDKQNNHKEETIVEKENENNQSDVLNGNVLNLDTIYKQDNNCTLELSDTEDDEETYIVYPLNKKEAIFLTKSSNYLREKDPLTKRTKCKWSLKILESCDRIKANTLRINFDTVKNDKQERIYTVAEDLCHELETELRGILSQRDLTEMNQILYRCINCNCQFSQENRYQHNVKEIYCPNCSSAFVAEIFELAQSTDKKFKTNQSPYKLSPAAIVEELPNTVIPITIQKAKKNIKKSSRIGQRDSKSETISKENPLNKSSSSSSTSSSSSCTKVICNKLTKSSLDSHSLNLGVGVTSMDGKKNGESDIDIISNPSQSSIEVLACQNGDSRKSSEERHISQVSNLETIIDATNYCPKDALHNANDEQQQKLQQQSIDLTEKHSNGLRNLNEEAKENVERTSVDNESKIDSEAKKSETNGLSSMFGVLFQSTNILMSSSKKLLEAEGKRAAETRADVADASTSNLVNITQPYKFNYSQFNEIDHRLKLYFYQTLFKERNEHVKWLIKGYLYNLQTSQNNEGLILMSTCKCYIMEAIANENDDVNKWLKTLFTCTIDRLERIQLLPWKLGVSIKLRDWGCTLLLLKDILRTDNLMLYFANNNLPEGCELIHQPSDKVMRHLNAVIQDQKLQMFCLLNACTVTCDTAKRSFNLCGLITTDSHIYLISDKINWLDVNNAEQIDIEVCVTQLMTNIMEVERTNDQILLISFLDETVNKEEQWHCIFETKENALSCLKAIEQSWEKLFGVPLT